MVKLLGVALNGGIPTCGTDSGAEQLYHSTLLQQRMEATGVVYEWEPLLVPQGDHPQQQVADAAEQVQRYTACYVRTAQPFVVLGGDHSMAMGTWAGTRSGCDHGLIWIDAHLDAHDFSTTPTGNIHGMPVATLLKGSPGLDPKRLVMVGIRSAEAAEWQLMERLGVRVYTIEELNGRGGICAVFPEIVERVSPQREPFGVSLDLDAINPLSVPAVCTPVAGGIAVDDLLNALMILRGDRRLLGLEIAEFSPENDRNRCTEGRIGQVIAAVYGVESNP